MSKSHMTLSIARDSQEKLKDPVHILEKHIMDTLTLRWHLQQVRIRSIATSKLKTRSLLDGMANEIPTFIDRLYERLERVKEGTPRVVEMLPNVKWTLFAVDIMDAREQLEAILSGYAHYARQTFEAIAGLRHAGDLESENVLRAILQSVERCLWFLEVYLEGLALNTDGSHLPDWPSSSTA